MDIKVDVIVESFVTLNEGVFTYNVPFSLVDKIKIGKRVLVSLGSSTVEGFVLGFNTKDSNYDLKDIIGIVDDDIVLNKELLELGKYISKSTMTNLIYSYQVMLPRALKASKKLNIKVKYINYIKLNINKKEALDFVQNNKNINQNNLIERLINEESIMQKDISTSILNSLIKKEVITIIKEEEYRLKNDIVNIQEKKELNAEQKNAFNIVKSSFNKSSVFLLHGVTGSGKTEVYMHLIDEVIKLGKEAIVLVPEITLTEQIVERFKSRFGNNVAILHSNLSNGEKYDEWRKIQRKEVNIVVGARSAIFAPFNNIGIIIVDEEHESTYKQDNSPKYNAIDVAIKRSEYHSCPVLLGSATPSIESYSKAIKKVYKLITLNNRVNNQLPLVNIVDMREEIKKGNSLISELLKQKIIEKLNKKEQIILLLNRRGYSSFVTCHTCGYTFKCPNCDISLTYYKTSNKMRCHYCGFSSNLDKNCKNCGSEDIDSFGIGTEKLEEYIKSTFDARVLRMDMDTTTKKGSHKNIIKSFMNQDYDILLGTQMIAKGLDFPLVTLVGVINCDSSLNIPDFRSSEKTYQLLSQVSGRAGRSKLKGEVIFQTYNKDHYSIKYASKHDYLSFYKKELEIRHMLKYSPFYFLISIIISSSDYELLSSECKKIKQHLNSNINKNIIILGPTPTSVFKVNNIYRYQVIIKHRNEDIVFKTLANLRNIYLNNKKITIDIDINPLKL